MQITSRITAVRRRPNTPSGNPVVVVEWADPNLPTGRQWARTAPDTTVAHRISHEDVGKTLTLILSDGKIVDVTVPKGDLYVEGPAVPDSGTAVTKRRAPLLVEGVMTSDGRFIEPGAIHWTEPVPVMAYDDGEGRVVGTATEIRRELDGTITALISAAAKGYPGADIDGYTSTFSLEAGLRAGSETFKISKARLRGVTMLDKDGWPWPDHASAQGRYIP